MIMYAAAIDKIMPAVFNVYQLSLLMDFYAVFAVFSACCVPDKRS